MHTLCILNTHRDTGTQKHTAAVDEPHCGNAIFYSARYDDTILTVHTVFSIFIPFGRLIRSVLAISMRTKHSTIYSIDVRVRECIFVYVCCAARDGPNRNVCVCLSVTQFHVS